MVSSKLNISTFSISDSTRDQAVNATAKAEVLMLPGNLPTPAGTAEIAAQSTPNVQPIKATPTFASDLSATSHDLDAARSLKPLSFPNPPSKEDGIPLTTIANIDHLLKMYGITVRYNVIKKKLEVLWPGQSGTTDNRDNRALTNILSLAALNRMNTGSVPAILETLADRNPHNPVADWIVSKPWDGVDRLEAFYETLVEREDYPKPLKEVLMHRWLISCVAAAMMPQGFYGRGILTLQGPQSIGKTSWIRAMIPDPILREQILKLDHHLDAGNKDSQITAICHWLVEIGELDSSLKKDVARLKGFITSDRDKLRKPYGRTNSEYQRRTVFCASVNDHAFLVDSTGNTRFWTIPVTKIDYQHTIDMQQLWAQIDVDFRNGEPWWLDRNEEKCLEDCNKEHRAVSAIRERLMSAIDHESTASNIIAYSPIRALQKLGISQPSNQQCKEAASIFRELFGDPKKIQGVYKWRVPLKRDRPGKFDKDLPEPDEEDLF